MSTPLPQRSGHTREATRPLRSALPTAPSLPLRPAATSNARLAPLFRPSLEEEGLGGVFRDLGKRGKAKEVVDGVVEKVKGKPKIRGRVDVGKRAAGRRGRRGRHPGCLDHRRR